jgi:hypothetical protein
MIGAGPHRWWLPYEGVEMVTRRSTSKGRASRKPFTVASRSAGLKGRHGKRVHAPEVPHMSAAEVGARLDEAESKLYRTGRRLAKVGHNSMREMFVAAEVIRRSLKEAFVAVRRAVRNIGKEVSAAAEATWATTKTL